MKCPKNYQKKSPRLNASVTLFLTLPSPLLLWTSTETKNTENSFFFQTCQILLQFQKTAKERVEIVISAILRGFNDH